MERNISFVRILRDGEPEPESEWRALSPEKRLEMVWQLTLDAWALKGKAEVELRLLRHVVRVLKSGS